jgi:hypothetical protein
MQGQALVIVIYDECMKAWQRSAERYCRNILQNDGQLESSLIIFKQKSAT